MAYEKFCLPAYPCESDMWDELKRERRPIVIYGMGNGADKLISRFDDYGISFADIFASDGFVRGHSFHGMRVKSFTEIRETYDDFVIVLSFATNREEVLCMLAELDMRYDMYIPDMPVAGMNEYFDRDFFNENYHEILKAYDRFEDGDSRNAYAAIINFKLFGRMKYLNAAHSAKDDIYSLLPCANIATVVDAGAYNGDTIREAKLYFPNLRKAYAIEPDNKNFKKLLKYSEAEADIAVVPINAAAWCEDAYGTFSDSGNRNSSVTATASYEHKKTDISLAKIDTVVEGDIHYIKYDVEGSEREALEGSVSTIERCKPTLLVSLYHRSRDIFELTNTLAEKYSGYRMYLRRLNCVPAWEIDLIMIPT